MTAGNKNLMHLIADGANGAKGQDGYAPQSGERRALIQAHRRQRDKQPNKEELYGMGDTTDVGAHPYANGGKRVGMGGGGR